MVDVDWRKEGEGGRWKEEEEVRREEEGGEEREEEVMVTPKPERL